MSTRTPDASPFRHHRNHYRYVDPTGQSYSPESDVGYGTSFGSQHEFGGHVDIDNISNLLVRRFDCTLSWVLEFFGKVIYWNVLQRSLSLNSGLGAGQPPTQAAFSDCGIPFPNLSSSSDGNSGQDESLEQSTDLDTSLAAATVGPCLAKLDPAVAQAVQQRFQVSSTLKLFTFSAVENYVKVLAVFLFTWNFIVAAASVEVYNFFGLMILTVNSNLVVFQHFTRTKPTAGTAGTNGQS